MTEKMTKKLTAKEKQHRGDLYLPGDEEIMEEQLQCLEKLYDFNQTRPLEQEKREAMLKEMFAEIGEGCYIEPPLHTNFGGKHVHFGKNCWIGAGVLIVPGITIGDNVVVGAGSVVTKDLPANVIAVGNPCHVLREINDHDREYYFKDRKIDYENL